MKQIAKILGMDASGDLLQVQSVESKDEFQHGGGLYGYCYEWEVNHYSFRNKEATKDAFGLTDTEYDKWDAQFIHRFDVESSEWYRKESIKTFNILETGE